MNPDAIADLLGSSCRRRCICLRDKDSTRWQLQTQVSRRLEATLSPALRSLTIAAREHGRAQRPFVTLNRSPPQARINVGRFHARQPLRVKLRHRSRPVVEVQIKPAGSLSDFAQTLLVEL